MAIKWHEIFAAVQQEHLAPVNITVTPEFEITTQPPRGDILLLRPDEQTGWTEEQRDYLPDGVRDSLAQHHILELKYTETVNQAVFEQVIGYSHFYRDNRQLEREVVRCFILSSRTTKATTRQQFGYHPTEHAGVYHSENILLRDIPLLLLNQLENTPHNVLFKLFGSREDAKLAALQGLKRWWLERLPKRLLWLLHGLTQMWFEKGDDVMDVVTAEKLIEEGKEFSRLMVQLTPTEQLQELLHDSPFVQQLQTEAETRGKAIGKLEGKAIGEMEGKARGEARGEAIGEIVAALAIRFQADRETWRERLTPLSLAQLEPLQQDALSVNSLAEFEQIYQTLQN